MKKLILAAFLLSLANVRAAAPPILDEMGRELSPAGFVALTEDGKGVIRYSADDYRRMVRMGANFQVIRLSLGRLGGWPGTKEDPEYLAQLDDMVRMGREAGLKTIFKLVVYGIRPFGTQQWDDLWKNSHDSQDALIAGWTKVWTRYQKDSSVFGYDLLNEPQCGLDMDRQRCVREQLIPTLRRITDAMHAISPDKWAFYQPLFRDAGAGVGPFEPMTISLDRKRIIYAPHFYTTDIKQMVGYLDRYEREAALSNAPLLIGEWGPSTALAVDSDPAKQATYTKAYQETASELDRRGIGGIKAWFCGSRSPLKNKKTSSEFTWAIFSDKDPVGKIERKHITNPLARPRPLVIAGGIESHVFNFKSRTLQMKLKPDTKLGASEIFVSTDRYYPSGIRIEIGTGLVMTMKRGDTGLTTIHTADESYREQAEQIRWDAEKLHLVIDKWILKTQDLDMKVMPLPTAGNDAPKKGG